MSHVPAFCTHALTLDLIVEVVCKLVHLGPAILDQRKDGVVDAAKLKADFVACCGVRIPESWVASYEQLCPWCVLEDRFDSIVQAHGKIRAVDSALHDFDCFITIICTNGGGHPGRWFAASTSGQVLESINALSL